MKEFTYKITDPVGIHARPAGLLVGIAGKLASTVTLQKGTKTADAKKIFSVMALGAKKDDEVRVCISGADEEQGFCELKEFFEKNL